MKHPWPLIAASLLGGCSVAPKYVAPLPAVPQGWPVGDTALRTSEAGLPALGYRDVFRDERLQRLIVVGLEKNQDIRIAVANIATARGLYRVQRAASLPSVDASASISVRQSGSATASSSTQYSVDIGASAFEIDLFGRVRNLSNAALNSYFATEAAARAVRLTLVADIADAWLTLATDRTLLGIARETATSAERSVALTRARLSGGIAPRTDVRQAETVLATAQSDVASLTTIVQQDRNALDLLVGAPVAETDLPPSIEAVESAVAPVAAGLDSSILLRRPDVVEAEYRLRAANAQIGVARAAFFPRISLTGLAGFASTALGSLFSGGAFNASITPNATLPIFDGGANRGNLDAARAQFDAATATYQKSIQSAFRDVADALARRATIADQAGAQTRLEAAARDTAMLTDARYRGGVASFLESLDAQRSLYSARRSLASTRLVRARNLVDLYRAIGGDPTLG
ncbi:efflux transporter outer membrane subunit [Sphingomonas sp. SUN039]|uniref:efflux transporter outer membrane subunit n=1 Tax=Sphingomonas sp. SUN039 TaxID=2937787 RepID=UPI00216410AB|nr:efflux transporter outer membrane subunit [Sphingomonas sp. SUN039]UVO53136.1 efflux transporter outer membrane subunit [Sphingomonas sp. SUN039]